jgi:hypothetical protein
MSAAPTSLRFEPWFEDVLARAHLRPGARVLLLSALSPAQCRAVLAAIGAGGTLTVIEPDRYRAAALDGLAHEGLSVLAYQPDGSEVFGVHDALIACPPVLRGWPMNRFGELAVRNLRPGGRLSVDLPGERHCEVVSECWAAIQAPPELLAPWRGPNELALAKLLRADGLREVEPHVSTHLVRFDNPHELAHRVGDLLGAGEELVARLQLALTSRLGSHDAVELLFRRTRVSAMR